MASVSFHVELDSSSSFARRSLIKKEYKEFLETWDFLFDQFGGPEGLFSGSTTAKLFLLGAPVDVDCDRVELAPNRGIARFFSSDVGLAAGNQGNEVSFGVGSFDEEFYQDLWRLFKKGNVVDVIAWSVVIWCSSIVGQETFSGFVSLTRKGLEWSLEKDGVENSVAVEDDLSVDGVERPKDSANNPADDEGPDPELLAIIKELEAGDQADFESTGGAKSVRRKKKKR